MLGLDRNAIYLLSAFAITVVVLVGYALYLLSRLRAVDRSRALDQSGRNVAAAAPMVTTVHTPNSANGPSAA